MELPGTDVCVRACMHTHTYVQGTDTHTPSIHTLRALQGVHEEGVIQTKTDTHTHYTHTLHTHTCVHRPPTPLVPCRAIATHLQTTLSCTGRRLLRDWHGACVAVGATAFQIACLNSLCPHIQPSVLCWLAYITLLPSAHMHNTTPSLVLAGC